MGLIWARAQQPQQVGCGHAVEIPDANHQARELAVAGQFVCFGAADAEEPGGSHQVDGDGQAGELADGQRGGVDGFLLGVLDSVAG